ncbi:MAG: hypothetical protein ACYCWW_21185 [Deltaproteobacteria bacterium]
MVESFTRPSHDVSWSAIFCGVVVAIALEGVLGFVGNALSLPLVSPINIAAFRTLDTGAVLWTLGVPLGSLFVGGLIAGLLSAHGNNLYGFLTGLLVWSVVGLFDMGLAALFAIGPVVGTTRPLVGNAAGLYTSAFWLVFFSACLALFGAIAGGLLAVRPGVREPFYREERRVIPQH